MAFKNRCTSTYITALKNLDTDFELDTAGVSDRALSFFKRKFKCRERVEVLEEFSNGIVFRVFDSPTEHFDIECIEFPRKTTSFWGSDLYAFSYTFWLLSESNRQQFKTPEELGRIFMREEE